MDLRYKYYILMIAGFAVAVCVILYFFAGTGEKKIAKEIEQQDIIKKVDDVKIQQDEKDAAIQKSQADSLKKVEATTEINIVSARKKIEVLKKKIDENDISIKRMSSPEIDSLFARIKTTEL